jgi:cytoskeletal protein CcmA (bactofilin family)
MFGKGSQKLETIVGNDTRIEGKVSVKGTIRVDGTVEGDVQADWVELREKARMVGEIHAPKLAISEGAVFDGRARMRSDGESAGAQEGNVRELIPTKSGG